MRPRSVAPGRFKIWSFKLFSPVYDPEKIGLNNKRFLGVLLVRALLQSEAHMIRELRRSERWIKRPLASGPVKA
jgi:hypothetical protein